MVFCHSGHLGDALYSLPAVQVLTGNEPAIFYFKTVFEDHNSERYGNSDYTQYDAIKDLLAAQPYIKEVRPFTPADHEFRPGNWAGLTEKFIDLDDSRKQPVGVRRYTFHVERYFRQFGIKRDYRDFIPWLTVPGESQVKGNYAIFHVTDRWNSYSTDWGKYLRGAREIYSNLYFTGYSIHHELFQKRFGEIEFLPTKNLLDLACIIRDSQAIYTNQVSALPIAQGTSHKNIFVAPNVNDEAYRTHCHTGFETVLELPEESKKRFAKQYDQAKKMRPDLKM